MAQKRTPRWPNRQGSEPSGESPTAVSVAEVAARQRLLDLAYDVSSRLRHHVQPAVRVSAALLVAASLAACAGDPSADVGSPPPTVRPLQQEVAMGLPGQPGRYPIVERSLQRDEQGVYRFGWREPGQAEGPGTSASASRIRLNQSNTEMLEIPAQGDPILHLRDNSEILLASAATQGTPTTGSSRGSHTYWRPMYVYSGGGPAYYDPPRSVPSGASTVDDARRSTAPAPPASRTYGVSHAVSGRAGGTGSGTAASARAGASISGGRSGVAASSSSGFSSGGAATSKGGGSASS